MVTSTLLPPAVRDAAKTYARQVAARFPDRRIDVTLFGSYARGEANEASDVDLAVVVDDLDWETQKELLNLGADIRLETEIPLAPTPVDRKTFELWLRHERAMALHIAREGIKL